eukprot:2033639-Rhodomonas_salina.4
MFDDGTTVLSSAVLAREMYHFRGEGDGTTVQHWHSENDGTTITIRETQHTDRAVTIRVDFVQTW